jgi:NhaP-type Na+/H+ or K+/H+ antiporter
MSDTWAQLATVALALVGVEFGERLHGSGFVAAFAGGLAYSMMVRKADAQMPSQVTDATGQLLELMVFAMFGSYAVFVGWRDADWRVVVFAVVALIVVRLIAVSAALLGTDLPAPSRLFIGWFGPRGIGTLVLGLLMIERGEIHQSAMITQAVVVTVTVSLVVHSLTTPLGIRLWPAPAQEERRPSGPVCVEPGTTPRPRRHPTPPPGRHARLWAGPAATPGPASRSRYATRVGLSPL